MNQAPEAIKQTEETVSVTSELSERIKNPFLAGFIIAWCIFNYDFWLIVFSEASINFKIGIIQNIYPTYSPEWWTKLFIYPALSSIAFRIISHILPIFDENLKVLVSPLIAIARNGSFKSQIEIRREITKTREENQNLLRQIDKEISKASSLTMRLNEVMNQKNEMEFERNQLKLTVETVKNINKETLDIQKLVKLENLYKHDPQYILKKILEKFKGTEWEQIIEENAITIYDTTNNHIAYLREKGPPQKISFD